MTSSAGPKWTLTGYDLDSQLGSGQTPATCLRMSSRVRVPPPCSPGLAPGLFTATRNNVVIGAVDMRTNNIVVPTATIREPNTIMNGSGFDRIDEGSCPTSLPSTSSASGDIAKALKKVWTFTRRFKKIMIPPGTKSPPGLRSRPIDRPVGSPPLDLPV